MIRCEEMENEMIGYIDHSISESAAKEIETHLRTCERCREMYRETEELLSKMSTVQMEQPDASLRVNFNHMLQSEMYELKKQKAFSSGRGKVIRMSHPLLKIAAGVAILVAGVLIGLKIKPERNDQQISDLRNEVKEVKEVLMFSLLNKESASDRIKAVGYAEEIQNPNQQVITALVSTLNNDKNVNVRMAAAYSLAKFIDTRGVSDALVESLSRQTEPILQVVLINILAEKKETKAIKPIQQIIRDKNTLQEVKDVAQKSMKVLL